MNHNSTIMFFLSCKLQSFALHACFVIIITEQLKYAFCIGMVLEAHSMAIAKAKECDKKQMVHE